MREIRAIGEDLKKFAEISANAYPGMKRTAEELYERYKELLEVDKTSSFYGIYEDELLGGMRLLDLKLNYLGKIIPAAGLGLVSVDLIRKKQGIARDMVKYFLDHYRAKGTYLALLYPFRPDFYKEMGFGYGSKMHRYSFKPLSLSGKAKGITYLGDTDIPEIEAFYTEYAKQKHGYCLMSNWDLAYLKREYISKRSIVGYRANGKLRGYLTFYFDLGENFLHNNLVIDDWFWLDIDALEALSGFLRSQADQFDRIIYHTTDPDFVYLLSDVGDGTNRLLSGGYHESNTSGVGLMYRIIDLREFLEQTSYREYKGNLDLTLVVKDSFAPENEGEHHLSFVDGKLIIRNEPVSGYRLEIDIADLSSLLMGSVSLRSLARLGRVSGDMESLEDLFSVRDRPECVTHF